MTEASLAERADYADALLAARFAKHVIFLVLLLMLVAQIALFFVARQTDLIVPATPTTTRPASAEILRYVASGITFVASMLPILLALVLLLILNIMLVGRLLGLGRTTSAFLWCLVLTFVLFPWQTFFGGSTDPNDFRLPGLIYTWDELVLYAKFPTRDVGYAFIKWARFLGWPLVAVILLMIVQIKSNRGLRQALNEAGATARVAEPNINITV